MKTITNKLLFSEFESDRGSNIIIYFKYSEYIFLKKDLRFWVLKDDIDLENTSVPQFKIWLLKLIKSRKIPFEKVSY